MQTTLFVLCGNCEVQLFALGDIAHQLAPTHNLLGLIRGAQVVGDDGYEARHDRLDHVHSKNAVAELAQRCANRPVDLVDKGRALADAAIPALDKVAQYEPDQHIQAVRHDEGGGVYGLHHVLVALGEGLHLRRPPLWPDKRSMAGAIVDLAVSELLVPGRGESQPSSEDCGRNRAGNKGIGQIVQLRLPVGEVAPCDEYGDGGEDYISALQGHSLFLARRILRGVWWAWEVGEVDVGREARRGSAWTT